MYIIGFCETIVVQVGPITNDPTNDIRLYGSLFITILLLIAVFGISWIIKVQFLLLFELVLAIISFMIGSFRVNNKYNDIVGINEWLNGNLLIILHHIFNHYQVIKLIIIFFVWFGIFFLAATGIMAGGTLAAIIVHNCSYGYGVIIAVSHLYKEQI